MIQIAPSMLSADFLHLEKDVKLVDDYADIFHLDVMDGVLVPNISYGFPVIEAIASIAKKPLDAHLMIVSPERYFERFASLGTSMLSFHLEACDKDGSDPRELANKIHNLGMKAGLAINPDIPVERVYPYLEMFDFVLVMSVFAGFGGQKFIEETYSRILSLKGEIRRRDLECQIEVDGGVSPSNAERLAEVGADILVAGSAVFRSDSPEHTIAQMKDF